MLLKNTLNWFVQWRWWLIGLIIFIIINMQTAELMVAVPKYYHLLEFLLYLNILILGGIFLELQLRGSAAQARTLSLLDNKHRLSLTLAGCDDWDELVVELARFPASVSGADASCLFIRDAISGQFEHAAYWHQDGKELPGYTADEAWRSWTDQVYAAGQIFHRCLPEAGADQVEYCLPIRQAENLLAFIRFRLVTGQVLSLEEEDIYKSVGDEMALALKVGQARRSSYELNSSQAALAERRIVSHYLHDNLGQNLGYLRLKLDQLLSEREYLSIEQIENDLVRMREAANESYEIVRGALETIHPKTMPHLMNLLQEHANKVAERAHLAVNFEVRGRPFPFKDDVQSAIFYVFHEVLSNVEKHSRADCIDILGDWQNDGFVLTISDNGVGFNPQTINASKHFGLEIMNERINNINGHINLKTSQDLGTIVVISVPTLRVGH